MGLCLAVAVAACGGDAITPAEGEGVVGEWVQSGGRRRDYALFVPASYDPGRPTPLLIALHGFGGNGDDFATFTGFDFPAGQRGFIVAYPSGVGGEWAIGGGRTGADQAGVDDVQFLVTLIGQLADSFAVDDQRIYLAGLSQGAFMSLRAACDLPAAFAGVASVAATMLTERAAVCTPSRAMPVVYILGTDDDLVPWAGRPSTGLLSAGEAVGHWTGLNDCPAAPSVEALPDTANDGTTVTRDTHGPCRDGTEVVLYTVAGGGHTWPGALLALPPSLGVASRDIRASHEIVEFFVRH